MGELPAFAPGRFALEGKLGARDLVARFQREAELASGLFRPGAGRTLGVRIHLRSGAVFP